MRSIKVDSIRLLNTAEVSEMTGVPTNTLRYYRHIGKGPKCGKLAGSRVVYREQDVIDWVNAAFDERVSA